MLQWLATKLHQRRERQQQERKLAAEELRRRLSSPDFDVIARHFGAPISNALRALYSDRNELAKGTIAKIPPGSREDEQIVIAWYIPLDARSISEQWHSDDGLFDFADDGSASRYTVDPTDDDAEILYFCHEDQTLQPTGVRICDFLRLPES